MIFKTICLLNITFIRVFLRIYINGMEDSKQYLSDKILVETTPKSQLSYIYKMGLSVIH